ncbi:hypothetical protein [Actinomadura oligospora]|uniref:hypothetical protein n=1 Tax=Actinomadura oligospora TaxID=111804 RepID=UPI0012FCC3ED|nr:hypothetical protein [Actinomadura oligospora]
MAPGVGADASAQTASKPGQTATVVGTAPKTAASTLAAPTLTSVTREGDNLSVIWKASPSDGVKDYVLFADKRLAKRVTTEETDPEDRWVFNVAADGLTDTETYAIAAEDGTGNLSPLSNSMTASPPKTLTPTPQMVSAVIRGDQVTLTWTASHTDEVSGELWYWFFVDGKPYKINGVRDVTSVTLPVSDSDPVDPTGFNPGAKVTVMASDYTLINHSATSSPVVATTG